MPYFIDFYVHSIRKIMKNENVSLLSVLGGLRPTFFRRKILQIFEGNFDFCPIL